MRGVDHESGASRSLFLELNIQYNFLILYTHNSFEP